MVDLVRVLLRHVTFGTGPTSPVVWICEVSGPGFSSIGLLCFRVLVASARIYTGAGRCSDAYLVRVSDS